MSRKSRIELDAAGGATLRLTLRLHTWQLITRYATKMALDADDAARILLGQVEALIGEGSVSWLSVDWQQALKEAHNEAPPELAGIDLRVLHRSDRTKSGFVGIYANGAGFRATGRRGEYLGTFKTAEQAAWQRYTHYKKNGLPYGELELEIDRLRRDGEHGSDEQLREIALELARQCGTLHLFEEDAGEDPQMAGFAPGELEAAKQKLAERDAAEDLGWTIRRPDKA